jgi:hypothetical protein
MPNLSSPDTRFKSHANRPCRLIRTQSLPTLKPEIPLLLTLRVRTDNPLCVPPYRRLKGRELIVRGATRVYQDEPGGLD